MDVTFRVFFLIVIFIIVVGISINYLIPIWETIKLTWKNRKDVLEWTWEKALSWVYVAINPAYAAIVNKESPWAIVFFHLIWILVLNIVLDSYLRHFGFDSTNSGNGKNEKRQKERTVFIVIVIIFTIELLTQIFYHHSIVNVIKIILATDSDYENPPF